MFFNVYQTLKARFQRKILIVNIQHIFRLFRIVTILFKQGYFMTIGTAVKNGLSRADLRIIGN